MSWGNNPYDNGDIILQTETLHPEVHSFPGAKVVDCGDIPVSPFDNALAVDQMEVAYSTLLSRPTIAKSGLTQKMALDGVDHPRIVRFEISFASL
jgi:arginase family enzyme